MAAESKLSHRRVARFGRRLLPFVLLLVLAAFGDCDGKKPLEAPPNDEPVTQNSANDQSATRDLIVYEVVGSLDSVYANGARGPELTNTGQAIAHDPEFTPDGTQVLHTCRMSGQSICSIDPSGGNRRVLVTQEGGAALSNPTMRFDSSRVIFESDSGASRVLGVHNFQTSTRGTVASGQILSDPDYHPTTSAVVFVGQEARGVAGDLYLLHPSGTIERLTNTNALDEADPQFSPDGNRIAFAKTATAANSSREIFVMDVATKQQRQLTNDNLPDMQPAWSPDGSRIAYASSDGNTFNIHTMNASDGSNDSSLVGSQHDHFNPTWANVPVMVSVQDNQTNEHDRSMPLRVQLTSAATVPVSVDYSIVARPDTFDHLGGAILGVDYRLDGPASGTLTFAPGQTSKVITVTPIDDNIDEAPDEQLQVTLSNARGATLGTAFQGIEIRDNDAAPDFQISDGGALEGQEALVKVALSAPSGREEVKVKYETTELAGGAKAGGDYTTTSGALFFAPGETEKTIKIPTTADQSDEPDERFEILLYSNYGAGLPDPTATMTIVEDAATVTLSGGTAREGGASAVEFTARLSRAMPMPVTALFSTAADGTASVHVDYVHRFDVPVVFAPGQTTVVVPVTIRNDSLTESSETFSGVLTQASGALLGSPSRATGTISDDDTRSSSGGSSGGGSGGGGGGHGGEIVYSRGDGAIYIASDDGSNPEELTDGSDFDSYPDLSPDASTVIFARGFPGSTSPDLYTISASGGTPALFYSGPGGVSEPAWSPDGTRVAFSGNFDLFDSTTDEEIFIYDTLASGSQLTQITKNTLVERAPDWSPSGDSLAFQRIDPFSSSILTVDVSSGTPGSEHFVGYGHNPAWSLDGAQIAFNSDDDGDHDLYIATVGSSGSPEQVFDTDGDDEYEPTWSSDETLIFGASGVSASQGHLFEVDITTDDVTPLSGTTSGVGEYSPDWAD